MLSDSEQKALSQIKEYLGVGYSLDALRDTGWAEWINHFESTGVT